MGDYETPIVVNAGRVNRLNRIQMFVDGTIYFARVLTVQHDNPNVIITVQHPVKLNVTCNLLFARDVQVTII